MIDGVANKLLLSALLVSLTASFGNSFQHCGSAITDLKIFLMVESGASFLSMTSKGLTDFDHSDNCKVQILWRFYLVMLSQSEAPDFSTLMDDEISNGSSNFDDKNYWTINVMRRNEI